jgi:hypothetical protein
MLEDLDTIDMVIQTEPGDLVVKIIDGAVTTDEDEFARLLKAKIAQAILALEDDEYFESVGSPTRLRIEVVHFIPRPPYDDDVVYTVGPVAEATRPLDVSLVFVLRKPRYNMPWMN